MRKYLTRGTYLESFSIFAVVVFSLFTSQSGKQSSVFALFRLLLNCSPSYLLLED
jgi:hypothetical protein